MSLLTAQLVPASKVPPRRTHWLQVFTIVADRLVAKYGVPSLGNLRDPVQEIFYITLSARTTDSQYRKTYLDLSVVEKYRAKPTTRYLKSLLKLERYPARRIHRAI